MKEHKCETCDDRIKEGIVNSCRPSFQKYNIKKDKNKILSTNSSIG